MNTNERIGIITSLRRGTPSLAPVRDFGLKACQLVVWDESLMTDDCADAAKRESAESGVRVVALWCGWPGPAVWDFVQGPSTLGIVPAAYRAARMEALRKGARFAARAGLPAVITHLGFIPENPNDPIFADMVVAVRELALYMKNLGLEFWFETGQETPVTMLRLIEAVGTGNLGINLDPANLIMYGKANPIDALDVFGQHVRCLHAKDGLYPTDPMKLGREVKVGTGRVRFPELVKRLDAIGFKGCFIIEREIEGEQQSKDIRETVEYLEALLS